MFWGLRVGREPTRDYSLTLLLSELQTMPARISHGASQPDQDERGRVILARLIVAIVVKPTIYVDWSGARAGRGVREAMRPASVQIDTILGEGVERGYAGHPSGARIGGNVRSMDR